MTVMVAVAMVVVAHAPVLVGAHTGCYGGDGLGGGCCGGTLVVVIEAVGMPIIGIPVNR